MIELRSDTFTLPTTAMLAAMTRAPLGDDVYGEDPTVAALEAQAAERFGKEAASLMPSGTMANLAAIMAQTPRGGRVLVGTESDIYCYEAGGASVCGGAVFAPLPNQPDGRIRRADLAGPFLDDPDDPQFAPPAMICLENTHNRCGGVILPPSYQAEVAAFAAERAVALHVDGARIFNAAVGHGVPVTALTAGADTVSFCLSKSLGAPIGSMVVGTAAMIGRVKRVRKMLGGGMRQAGVVAAAGLVALDEMVDRLRDDHANARRLAAGLAQIAGLAVYPVHTNMVFFELTEPDADWRRFVESVARAGVRVAELGHGRIRAVTHASVDQDDIDRAVALIADVMTGALIR